VLLGILLHLHHSGKVVIRVLVADDHVLVRRGLRELCREMDGYSVAGMAANSDDVLAALSRACFDLIVLDLSMPGIACREMLGAIRHVNSHVPILIFGVFDDPLVVKRVLQAGAIGVVSKRSSADTLMLAIRKVASGGRFIDSLISERLVFDLASSFPMVPGDCLSPRELQVMKLLARGLSVTAIAADLSISDKTVSTHKIRLMRKLNIHNDAELVRCAVDDGLVD